MKFIVTCDSPSHVYPTPFSTAFPDAVVLFWHLLDHRSFPHTCLKTRVIQVTATIMMHFLFDVLTDYFHLTTNQRIMAKERLGVITK